MSTSRLIRAVVPRRLRVPPAVHLGGHRVNAWSFLFVVAILVIGLFLMMVGAEPPRVARLIVVPILIGLIVLEIRPAGRSMRTMLRITRRQLLRARRLRLDSTFIILPGEAALATAGRRPRWQPAAGPASTPQRDEGASHE